MLSFAQTPPYPDRHETTKLFLSCNSSAHAIRNLALRASKLTIVSGLLMNGRSAHKQSVCSFMQA